MFRQYKLKYLALFLLGYFTISNSQNWHLLGLENYEIQSIAVHPQHPDTIYVGGYSSYHGFDLFISANGGLTWDTLYADRSVTNIVIHPENHQIMYIADGLIEKTIDGGQNWFPVDSGIYLIEELIYSIAFDPKFPNTLFAGSVGFFGGKLYKTVNGGDFWVDISDTIFPLHESITKIAINPVNNQMVLVGTAGSGQLMRTTDGGLTWLATGLQLDQVNDIEIDSRDPNIIYVGGHTGGIYKSEDSGVSWLNHNNGLPISARILGIEISHESNQLFLVTGNSIYQSQMDSIFWNEYSNGLPAKGLINTTLKFDSLSSSLYLGTQQGIYVNNAPSNLDDKSSLKPENLLLYPNYPNPFNSQTTIGFYLPFASQVKLEIYNLLGQKVRTLWQGRQSMGQHQLRWDGKNDAGLAVSSGMYIYRLKTDYWQQTKKLVLIR
jgi:photosystem II stability/assembly factor-like uncharacterized protein